MSLTPDDELSAPPEALVERVAAVLRQTAPPTGLPDALLHRVPDADADSSPAYGFYALWSAMTALTQEVKLQGRAFGKVRDELQRQREDDPRVAPQADADVLLGAAFDLRDRLRRGLEAARTHREQVEAVAPSWLDRLLRRRAAQLEHLRDAAAGVEATYQLAVDALDAHLARIGIVALEPVGMLFDPATMNAVDVEPCTEGPDGSVVEVYRCGFVRGGVLVRCADVKVARRVATNEDPPTTQPCEP